MIQTLVSALERLDRQAERIEVKIKTDGPLGHLHPELARAYISFTSSANVRSMRLGDQPGVTSRALSSLLGRLPLLQRLDVPGCLSFNDEVASAVAQQCRHLRRLDCSRCSSLGDPGVEVLSAALGGSLEWLSVSNCPRIGDAGVLSLSQHSLRLQTLKASHLPHISSKTLRILLQRCKRLRRLDIAHCPAIDGQAFLLPSMQGTVAVNISSVVELCVSGALGFNDTALLRVADSCHLLRRIALEGCRRVTDVGVMALCRSTRELESLEFSQCPKVSSMAWVSVLRHHHDTLRTLWSSDTTLVIKRWWRYLRQVEDPAASAQIAKQVSGLGLLLLFLSGFLLLLGLGLLLSLGSGLGVT